MKLILNLLLIAIFSLSVTAQTFPVETIKDNGNSDNRINIVILGDGYQNSELDQFITDATSFSNSLFSQSPFLEYESYFNVYAIRVPSNESGADHPGTAADEPSNPVPVSDVDTYFNSAFDSFNIHRLLTSQYAPINTVLANNFPNYDEALVLVNSPYYGGSGGQFAVSSTGSNANEISIHEIGHSFGNLRDEYYAGDNYAQEGINMTQDNNPTTVKWKNWINTNGVGTYVHGSSGQSATWYRPHQNCKMRYLGAPFCAVCKEGFVEKIHSLVSPIDSYSPNINTVENPSFPADFQLDLILPNPNTLETTWTLNASEFATNVNTVSLEESDLNDGTNFLMAVVHDNSPLLRVDNHETIHIYTVSWTINAALSVEEFTTESNAFSISMFPNPSQNVVTFEFESRINKTMTIELVTMEGKLIKRVEFNNTQSPQIDISALSDGVYLTNFYVDNTKIATKKLVKN
ncbi:M64 family metallopeptidase [Lacinutrix salivirga]